MLNIESSDYMTNRSVIADIKKDRFKISDLLNQFKILFYQRFKNSQSIPHLL